MILGFVGGDNYEQHYKDRIHFTEANVDCYITGNAAFLVDILFAQPTNSKDAEQHEQKRHRAACPMTYTKIKS